MKKALAILLAALMLLTMMVGCASEPADTPVTPDTPAADEPSSEPTADEPAEAPADESAEEPAEDTGAAEPPVEAPAETAEIKYPLTDEPVTYTVFANGLILGSVPDMEDLNQSVAVAKISEITGVNIDWEIPSAAAMQEQLNLMIVSEDYTDGLVYYSTSLTGGLDYSIEEEIIIDLKDIIHTSCPNYLARVEADESARRGAYTDGGHMGAMYKMTDRRPECYGGFYVVESVLEEAGFSADSLPRTYEDFELILAAGKDDASNAPLYLDGTSRIMLSVGLDVGSGFSHNGDNQLVYGPATDAYKQHLSMLADWYAEGYVDKDFASRSSFYADMGLMMAGEFVVMPGVFGFSTVYTNNGLSVQPIPLPALEAGAPRYLSAGTNDEILNGDCLMIFTSCENPTLLAQHFDYGYSDEGAIIANFGVEGETFEYDENGEIVYINRDPDKMEQWYSYGSMLPFLSLTWREYIGEPELATRSRQIWEENWSYENHKAFGSLTAEEGEQVSSKYSDIQTRANEYTMQAIQGSVNIDETWDAFVDELYAMGLEEVTATYQAAHDRYLAR